jgi:putative membrane protein
VDRFDGFRSAIEEAPMMWWGDWGWGAWVAMTVMMLAFWALVIWLVVTLMRGGERRLDGESILAERFARGDIDEDEYSRRRELLRSSE